MKNQLILSILAGVTRPLLACQSPVLVSLFFALALIISGCSEKQAPSIAISWPTNDFTTTNELLDLKGVSAARISKLEFSVNDCAPSLTEQAVWLSPDGTLWTANLHLPSSTNDITIRPVGPSGSSGPVRKLRVILNKSSKVQVEILKPTSEAYYGTYLGKLTLEGKVTLSDSNLAIKTIKWTNTRGGTGNVTPAASPWSIPDVVLFPGENTVEVNASDSKGNTGQGKLVIQYAPDKVKPTLALSFPTEGRVVDTTEPTLELRGIANDNNGVDSVDWSINWNPYQPANQTAAGWSHWTVPRVPLIPGPNQISVRATDTASNATVVSLIANFHPPSEAVPTLTISSPISAGVFETSAADLKLAGGVSVGAGLPSVEWSLNGGLYQTATVVPPTWSVPAIHLVDGENRITVVAYDSLGKSSPPARFIAMYVPLPRIKVFEPLEPEFKTTNTSVILRGVVKVDSAHCIDSVTWKDNGNPVGVVRSQNPAWNTGPIQLWIGKNTLEISAADDAGQVTKTNITITRVQPELVEVGPAKIANALDKAQKLLAEYGTINLSAPVLSSARSNEFYFSLSNGPAYYFNDAKTNTQGMAANFSQRAQSASLALQAQWDPTVTASYLNDAKNFLQQDRAYQLRQQSLQNSASAQLLGTLEQGATNTTPGASNLIRASALQTFANGVYGTNAPPSFPTSASYNTNLGQLPTNLLPANGSNAPQLMAMRDFLGLLTGIPSGLAIEDRSALITAAGDHAIESFFRALGDSSLFGNFVNSEVYFGLTTVSINPGWRTKTDWAGEVSVSASLNFEGARRETILRILNEPFWPVKVRARVAKDYGYPYTDSAQLRSMGVTRADEIAATMPGDEADALPVRIFEPIIKPVQVMIISPLLESQTFNLADSQRTQTEMALYLAAAASYAGAKGAAQAFLQFAKSRQSDIATRTPMAMVNAFSGQNGSYGFQIGPRIQALANPANGSSKAGNILEKQSFPALLLLSLSKGDIEPRVFVDNGRFKIYEPYITLHQTHRWMPLKHFRFSRDWYNPFKWFSPVLSEDDRLYATIDLEHALPSLRELGLERRFNINSQSTLGTSLADRATYYEKQLIGSVDEVRLPFDRLVPNVETEDIELTNVTPNVVTLRVSETGILEPVRAIFLIQGKNLDGIGSPITTVYTNACDISVLNSGENSAAIVATVTNADSALIFSIPCKRGSRKVVNSPPITIKYPRTLPFVMDTEPKLVTLKRGSSGSTQSTNIDVVIVGSELKRVALDGINVASGYATVATAFQRLGDGLKASLTITNAGQAISLRLPVMPLSPLEPTNFILSGPIQVELEPLPSTSSSTNKPSS